MDRSMKKHDADMESSNDAADVDNDSETSVNFSESSETSRQNRFKGPRSTWRRLTEDDRLVSTSVTQLRDQDLSIHLYNAHAMKRRHYDQESISNLRPWANKDRWRGNNVGEGDETNANFVPPRSWTAWPLSSDVVPRNEEQVGAGDDADEWTFKRQEPYQPSRELEDILMAITLRVSRVRFVKRKFEGSHEQEKGEAEERAVDIGSEPDSVSKVEGKEPAEETAEYLPTNAPDNIWEETDKSQGNFGQVDPDGMSDEVSYEAQQRMDMFSSLQEEGQEPTNNSAPVLKHPSVSTDDERSRRLLRPTIRHTLSRLDELLMSLHDTRQTCLHYASDQTGSQSDFEGVNPAADDSDNNGLSHPASSTALDDPSPEQPVKRSKPGRPPKVLHMPAPSATDTVESIEINKKEKRGRKRKLYVPLEGESYEEMLVRIARQQKKALPFTSVPTGFSSSSATKSARGSSQKRGTSAHTRNKRSTRLGLRDWSEILGTAALLGFSPDLIDRATQRCTNLFGEGMTMLSLVENATPGNEDQFVDYFPGEIPDFDNLKSHRTAGSESDEIPKINRRPPRGHNRNKLYSDNEMDISKSEAETRTSSAVDTAYYCSFTGCPRRKRGFSKKHYLTKHLREFHKLDQKDLQEALGDSQEEMEGAVHVNGFMREIKRRMGWRAIDGKPRQRKKGKGSAKTRMSEEEVPGKDEFRETSRDELDESDSSLDEAFESD